MRRRSLKKYVISSIAIVVSLCIVTKIMALTVPYISGAVAQAATISAGFAMPEGGKVLLNDNLCDFWDGKVLEMPTTDQNKSAPNEQKKAISYEPPTATFSQEEIDAYSQNNGQIIRKQYQASESEDYIKVAEHAYIKNMTKLPRQTVVDATNQKPAFTISDTNEPQVLIVHTHTTEAFELNSKDCYDASFPTRSLENDRNIVRVGQEIVKQLQAAGIEAVQDTTVHDNHSYNGAYDRSKETIIKNLEKYPSIKVVLDIHRDSIGSENGPRYAPYTTIDGRAAAQLMIISGCDSGKGEYPNYLQNLAFAALLERQTENDYPTLTRPASFKYKYYNQSLTPGTLLVEIGGHANSVDEAVYTGWMFGKSLANALSTIKE